MWITVRKPLAAWLSGIQGRHRRRRGYCAGTVPAPDNADIDVLARSDRWGGAGGKSMRPRPQSGASLPTLDACAARFVSADERTFVIIR